ncbi:MAG: GFA family protein [Sphingomonas sp.]|uniref:GFA family protein n=1 Tax=Sphingomonas sp. TaxID=28214 RepID=UPI001B146E55|nr:GFA family protein [Sphingomonas sp.]MBO9623461.1 GFA family protein [Sphingomonas sp.]
MAGGCRCGAVRYTVSVEETPPIYCCHCLICQTGSGSAFAMQAMVAEEALQASGPIEAYRLTALSGAEAAHMVCGTCHTRLWNVNSARPGLAILRAGTLDASDTLVPRAHIWTRRKQPWIVIADDVPQYPENAPVAELAALLFPR